MKIITIITAVCLLLLVTSCNKDHKNAGLGITQFTITGDGFSNTTFSNNGISSTTAVLFESATPQTQVGNLDLRSSSGDGSQLNIIILGQAGTSNQRTVGFGYVKVQVGNDTYEYDVDNVTATFTRYDAFTSLTALVEGTFNGTFTRQTGSSAVTVQVNGRFSGYRSM